MVYKIHRAKNDMVMDVSFVNVRREYIFMLPLCYRVGKLLSDFMGFLIIDFNSIDFSRSMHYNPLAYIRNEADILKFVNTLIANTKGSVFSCAAGTTAFVKRTRSQPRLRGCSRGLGCYPNKQKQRFPAAPGTTVSSLCGNKDTACYNGDTRFYIHFTIPLF